LEIEAHEYEGRLAYVVTIRNAGSSNGGVMPMTEPIDLPQPGRIAVLLDPQGAAFAVCEGETDY
jgi:predicted enzyme related to lactoylglutathione lyase